jgi:hypothetical protein
MHEAVKTDHTWFRTMVLPGVDELIEAPRHWPVRAEYRADLNRRCAIKVLACHGASVAIIAWMDPTTCCYGEQLWRRCVARKSGICALSGQTHHG